MKKVYLGFVVALLAIGAYFYGFTDYSDGERVGIITKFSRKGMLFKTNEGVAQLNGTVLKNEWEFSVPSEQVAEQVRVAQETGRPVVLKYAERNWKTPWLGETHYYVVGVKVTQ